MFMGQVSVIFSVGGWECVMCIKVLSKIQVHVCVWDILTHDPARKFLELFNINRKVDIVC